VEPDLGSGADECVRPTAASRSYRRLADRQQFLLERRL
jgi:hypothetical protein